MGLFELFILAVGLAMDAFAVSVCKGLAMPKITLKKTLIVGAWFGGFQALMPAIGYVLGVQFRDKITAIDHWIAFVLLGIIGANMIKEACSKDCDCEDESESLDIRTMFLLAVATSIDALAVGITFAFLNVHIVAAVSFIGVTTFVISAIGVKIGTCSEQDISQKPNWQEVSSSSSSASKYFLSISISRLTECSVSSAFRLTSYFCMIS